MLLLIVLVKVWAQCTGADKPNDGDLSDSSTWRLHDAFLFPHQKLMGQGTQVLFVITLLCFVNINVLHSGNLELCCIGGFVAYIVWVLVGSHLIYRA